MSRSKYIYISKGRFAGEPMTYAHHGLFGAITTYYVAKHPIDNHNVKAFYEESVYPIYGGKLFAYVFCIVWRDNTKSYFTAGKKAGKRIAKSLQIDYLNRKFKL